MNMKTGVIFAIIGTVVVIAVVSILGIKMSANNEERQLRNLAEAQIEVLEAKYDNTWKVLKQQAQVADKYKDSFKEIFQGIIEGRYTKDDNVVMKWVQESNPNFDSSMYKELMANIDIKRTEFLNEQKKLTDIARRHKDLLVTEPKSWFITNTSPIEYKVISSDKTKEVMKTGVDNDIDLF